MSDPTTIPLGGEEFATTPWSTILRADHSDEETRRQLLEKLLTAYWRPLYAYARDGFRFSPEDAQDLVQSFALTLLQREFLQTLDPTQGRFRAFLKTALKNFMSNQVRDDRRIKRGGGRKIVPLEAVAEVPAHEGTPDDVFDAEWSRSLLEWGIERLRAELTQGGKSDHFRVFELYDVAESERTYSDVAKETGLSESDVRNYLHVARSELRRILIERIREYTLDAKEAAEELGKILG